MRHKTNRLTCLRLPYPIKLDLRHMYRNVLILIHKSSWKEKQKYSAIVCYISLAIGKKNRLLFLLKQTVVFNFAFWVEANVCMFFYSVFPLEIRFAWKIPAASLCMASFVDFCDIAGHHCLNVLTIAEFLIGKQLVLLCSNAIYLVFRSLVYIPCRVSILGIHLLQ
jgi:hypothetical protein